MGLVSHEAPRLTSNGPVPYDDDDAGEPLQEGMVVSIETTMPHPKRGFIKLEDTVAVTATGCEGFGDTGRVIRVSAELSTVETPKDVGSWPVPAIHVDRQVCED